MVFTHFSVLGPPPLLPLLPLLPLQKQRLEAQKQRKSKDKRQKQRHSAWPKMQEQVEPIRSTLQS